MKLYQLHEDTAHRSYSDLARIYDPLGTPRLLGTNTPAGQPWTKDEVVHAMQPVIHSMARQAIEGGHHNTTFDYQDAVQNATIGLLDSLTKHTPTPRSPFTAYARQVIHTYIKKGFHTQEGGGSRLYKMAKGMVQDLFKATASASRTNPVNNKLIDSIIQGYGRDHNEIIHSLIKSPIYKIIKDYANELKQAHPSRLPEVRAQAKEIIGHLNDESDLGRIPGLTNSQTIRFPNNHKKLYTRRLDHTHGPFKGNYYDDPDQTEPRHPLATTPPPNTKPDNQEQLEALMDKAGLNERERHIMLMHSRDIPKAEIAKELYVSYGRVSQIYTKAMAKLKAAAGTAQPKPKRKKRQFYG